MRGKDVAAYAKKYKSRITPAYAGKSGGEKRMSTMYEGSPPPMRGKVFDVSAQFFQLRITPAYAGKRFSVL